MQLYELPLKPILHSLVLLLPPDHGEECLAHTVSGQKKGDSATISKLKNLLASFVLLLLQSQFQVEIGFDVDVQEF